MSTARDTAAARGFRSVLMGICVNLVLAAVKATAGVFGNSYALIADAIESAADIITSIIVTAGLKLSRKPPDHTHPYGHGKVEPLAGVAVALSLIGASLIITIASLREIATPHHAPAPFTLYVLLGAIITKEYLFRRVFQVGSEIASVAVKSEAWHHRSDALTSLAAFIGISIALIGGPGFESADDYAALVAALVIATNAILLLRPALAELLDKAPDRSISVRVREIACQVPGVLGTHKCHVRKVGFDYYVDLDVLCDPNATIRAGHEIAHNVGDAIQREMPSMAKVLVHVEPVDDYGRRSRDRLGEA